MGLADSSIIKSMLESHTQELDGIQYPQIEQILRNFFKANIALLWEDALKDHDLI